MFSEMRAEIRELSIGSTAYGVPNYFKSERLFNRIFWLLFMIVFSSLSGYFIHLAVVEYLNYEVFTVVKIEYDQPTRFPTVTFCARSDENDEISDNDIKKIIHNDTRFGYDYSVGLDPVKHFELVKTKSKGICFRFNSGNNMKNHLIPINNSTIGGRDDCFYLKIDSKYSLIVWVHEKNSPPKIQNRNNHDNPVLVNKGTKSYLAIEKIVDSKLEEPYNKCYKDVRVFNKKKLIIDLILNSGESYSQVKCLEFCFELSYIENTPCFQCTNTTLGNAWLDCYEKKERINRESCIYTYKTQFYQRNLAENCSEYCPLECDSVLFSHTISSTNSNDNFTTLSVYLSSLKYTSIKQQAKMQTIDLISNIGGTLGLFIGVSFVSLFEITEIIIEIIIICVQNLRRSKSLSLKKNPSKKTNVSEELAVLFLTLENIRSRTQKNEQQIQELKDLFENFVFNNFSELREIYS